MKPNFRKIKVSLVFAILLSVVVIAAANSTSAQIFDTRIEISEVSGANGSLSPGNPVEFKLKVDYSLVINTNNYIGSTNVQLEIIEGNEEWVTPTLSRRNFGIKPGESEEIALTVSITPDSPYLKSHNLIIRATAEAKAPLYQEAVGEYTVSIFPEFLYFVDANSLSNYAEVTPGETHKFPVNVVNDASYTVKYFFETQSVPKEWVVSAPDSLTVGPKSKEQVTISVAPPYDFGYHDEIEDFKVKVTAMPFPAAGGYEKQEVDTLNFQVKNRGFSSSASGGGLLIIIGIIIAVVVILFLVFMIVKTDMFKKKR